MIDNNDIMKDACINSKKPPNILYHYTNTDGLKGFIESGYFYASHFLFLNDPSEIKYSVDITKEVLEEVTLKENDTAIREILKIIQQMDFISRLNYQGYCYDVYIACFSEERDLLSQWRGYADNGMGYSICVEISKIPNVKYGVEYVMNLNIKPSIYLLTRQINR